MEREPLLSKPERNDWAFGDDNKGGPKYKVDYAVPNFGMDKQIKSSFKSLEDAEAKLGFWNIKLKPDPEPKRNYFVPDFGMDGDIKDSLKNLGDQEKVHGAMNPSTFGAVQLDEQREPLLSAPARNEFAFGDNNKKGPGYKMDYPVPNYGMDKEIKST